MLVCTRNEWYINHEYKTLGWCVPQISFLVQVFGLVIKCSSSVCSHSICWFYWNGNWRRLIHSVDRDKRNSVLILLTTLNTRSLSPLDAGIDKSYSDRVAMWRYFCSPIGDFIANSWSQNWTASLVVVTVSISPSIKNSLISSFTCCLLKLMVQDIFVQVKQL